MNLGELEQAATIVRQGGVVAFPTETFYGLAVDPFNEAALARLFAVKRRASDKAILVIAANRRDLGRLVAEPLPSSHALLMDRFWPGPLTIILPALPGLPPLLTGDTGTVGVRMSSHPAARMLAELCGGLITATSANLAGEPAACSPDEVRRQLAATVDYVVEGGMTAGGLGSTIIRGGGESWELVRPGATPFELVLAALS